MSDHRQLAARAVVARIVSDEIKSTIADLRAEIEPDMRARETLTAELPDGTEIGTVGRTKPSARPTVTDHDALVAWVAEHRPDELVYTVKPAYQRHLESTARKYGHAVDEATGEVVPGIEVVTGTAAYRVSPTESGRELVLDRLGDVLAGALPALPPGGESR